MLPVGCTLLLDMMRRVIGSHFKPVLQAYILNEDCSSQYYYACSVKSDHGTKSYARVKDTSLQSRGRDSVWKVKDDQVKACNGIRVEFACGGSGSGFIYPICIIVSNLSSEEFPSNDFKVIPIKGLSINAYIDPRAQKIGYLCLIGSNVSQQRFFE